MTNLFLAELTVAASCHIAEIGRVGSPDVVVLEAATEGALISAVLNRFAAPEKMMKGAGA